MISEARREIQTFRFINKDYPTEYEFEGFLGIYVVLAQNNGLCTSANTYVRKRQDKSAQK